MLICSYACSLLLHALIVVMHTCFVRGGEQDIYVQTSCQFEQEMLSQHSNTTCPKDWSTYLAGTVKQWKFDSLQLLKSKFPIDPQQRNYVRKVEEVLFSYVEPVPYKTEVRIVSFSSSVLKNILNMHPNIIKCLEFVNFVSGNIVPNSAVPLSHRYGGHQFGVWADQLGDGRAVMLGEYVNYAGDRWELQLKGSGQTPYSRRGDGRAVLRSSIREYLCSEAMFHLGIPTSRAATISVSNDLVYRDEFYNGNVQQERAAIVLRVSKSWFRFGSLEILANKGEVSLLKELCDFIIENYFPEIKINRSQENIYLSFYSEVILRTAKLVALWMSVGFAHGVMNTDNFSILSITIDYGPFGFLDAYNPDYIPNTSDDEGRYSYKNQPSVAKFNLQKLGLALQPLLSSDEQRQTHLILNGFNQIYDSYFLDIFLDKLGLSISLPKSEYDDISLVYNLLTIMQKTDADFTMVFRQLSEIPISQITNTSVIKYYWAIHVISKHKSYKSWAMKYKKRFKHICDKERRTFMITVNPRYVLRNWMAVEAIRKAEKNDFSGVKHLLRVLEQPYTYQTVAEIKGYADPPPPWSRSIKVSCSS